MSNLVSKSSLEEDWYIKSELEELKEERDYFMQTLMHNLKTPVRSEIRAIELLMKGSFGDLSEEQKEVLKEILNSSTQMMFMLDSIILKNKIEKNRIDSHPQKINLKILINDVIEEMRLNFENKKQTINLYINTSTETVFMDYKTLRTALVQLLSNAIKFSSEGKTIDIFTKETAENIYLSVQDYGVGMTEEEQKNVFKFNMHNYKKFNAIGAGLGLHIAKVALKNQGADITVTSKKDVGTTFTIIFSK